MKIQDINLKIERKVALHEFLDNLNMLKVYGIVVTGSSSYNACSKNSDFDLRIIVEDLHEFNEDIKTFLLSCNLISYQIYENFSEIKFFFQDIPFHVLFYTVNHIKQSMNQKKYGVIITLTQGKFVYKKDEIINPFIEQALGLVEEMKNNNEYYVASKSQFVKALSRFEQKQYKESLFCIRIASIYLIKNYLINNEIFDVKEQWLIRDLSIIDSKNKFLNYFLNIHGLGEVKEDSVKQCIRYMSMMFKNYEDEVKNNEKKSSSN